MNDYFDSACSVVDPPPRKLGEDIPFWRKDEPVLGDVELIHTNQPVKVTVRRVIRGGMWPAQRAWWNLPNFIRILVGGYGSGKTSIISKRIISLALQNAPSLVGLVSPTYPLARKTTIPTIIELLTGKQSIYGSQLWWRFNKSTHEFRIRFRGRQGTILILSGEDPTSLRGPNLAAAGIDEPFIQDEEVFKQMIARVRHPEAQVRELMLTGTPEGVSGWGYDLCKGKGKQTNDVGIIQVSTRQNLAINEDYVKRLEGAYSSKAALAYIEGEFVSLSEGLVYYGFHDTNQRELPTGDGVELGVGMDFNVNPMSAVVFWKSGSHLHFFKEYELPNADTEYMCEQLANDFGQRLQNVYPDASGSARKTSAPAGKTDFWYLQKAGYIIRANYENPKRKDRYNAVNGKLAPKVGQPTVTVSPLGCPNLVKYLSLYSHEEMNKQKALSHLTDAFSYPIAFLFPITKDQMTIQRVLT